MQKDGEQCAEGYLHGRQLSKKEQAIHINVLELLAIKQQTFAKMNDIVCIHFQIDNKTALSYLVKMGGTASPITNKLAKQIWEIFLKKKISFTAEYLPSALNQIADWESRKNKDSSDWRLCPHIFRRIACHFGHLGIDILETGSSKQGN